MTRMCNLIVLLNKNNISIEDLAKRTGISEERIRILIREPEEPKTWEAEAISGVLGVLINSIWPNHVDTTNNN